MSNSSYANAVNAYFDRVNAGKPAPARDSLHASATGARAVDSFFQRVAGKQPAKPADTLHASNKGANAVLALWECQKAEPTPERATGLHAAAEPELVDLRAARMSVVVGRQCSGCGSLFASAKDERFHHADDAGQTVCLDPRAAGYRLQAGAWTLGFKD